MQTRQPDAGEELEVSDQAKLLRIGKLVRELQEELDRVSVDESGRALLGQVYERALNTVGEALSADLRSELDELALRLEAGTPSEWRSVSPKPSSSVGWKASSRGSRRRYSGSSCAGSVASSSRRKTSHQGRSNHSRVNTSDDRRTPLRFGRDGAPAPRPDGRYVFVVHLSEGRSSSMTWTRSRYSSVESSPRA